MADITINALPSKTTWADTDIIIVQDGSDTKKMTVATLKGLLNTQATWTAPVFSTAWGNLGGSFAPCGHLKDTLGFVHLRGVANGGALNSQIYVLPIGSRPNYELIIPVISGSAVGLHIYPSGVVITAGTTTGWVALDGVTFKAEL